MDLYDLPQRMEGLIKNLFPKFRNGHNKNVEERDKWLWALLAFFCFTLAGVVIIALSESSCDGRIELFTLLLWFLTVCFASGGVQVYRKKVKSVRLWSLCIILPMAFPLLLYMMFLASGFTITSTAEFSGLTFIAMALHVFFFLSKSTEDSKRLSLRKKLASARRYFKNQLKKPVPDLKDKWIPYLIAFGLSDDMDRWVGIFGTYRASPDSGPLLSPGGSSGQWTGGCGTFGGAGTTGSWAVAAGLLGGLIGGGSSGGGGGGEW